MLMTQFQSILVIEYRRFHYGSATLFTNFEAIILLAGRDAAARQYACERMCEIMKKIISLITASMMLAMPVFALAGEDGAPQGQATGAPTEAGATLTPSATTAAGLPIFDLTPDEPLLGGAPLSFEDDNFTLTIPADWTAATLSEEQLAQGVIALLNDAKGAQALCVRRVAAEVNTLDELLTTITGIEGYTGAQVVLLSGIPCVAYTDSATGALGYCALEASGAGYLAYEFAGGEDATARQVLASLKPIDDAQAISVLTYDALTGASDANTPQGENGAAPTGEVTPEPSTSADGASGDK